MSVARDANHDGGIRDAAETPRIEEHADRGEGSDVAKASLQAAEGDDNGRRLIVFDFDRTIMKEHMWKKHRDTDLSRIRITDEMFVDIAQFRGFVFALKMRGHNVGVATFGRRDVVDKALHHALGDPHGVSVRTPADFGYKDGSGILGDKNTHLAALAQRYHVAAHQIILIDDDQKNVEAAADAGVEVRWVPKGLRPSVIKDIAAEVGVEPISPKHTRRLLQESEGVPHSRPSRSHMRRDTGPPEEMFRSLELLIGQEAVAEQAPTADVRTPELCAVGCGSPAPNHRPRLEASPPKRCSRPASKESSPRPVSHRRAAGQASKEPTAPSPKLLAASPAAKSFVGHGHAATAYPADGTTNAGNSKTGSRVSSKAGAAEPPALHWDGPPVAARTR
jgi:hypothetical protein